MQITTEDEYRKALAEIETLMMAERDTEEGRRLDELSAAVEAYEAIHYPIGGDDGPKTG